MAHVHPNRLSVHALAKVVDSDFLVWFVCDSEHGSNTGAG